MQLWFIDAGVGTRLQQMIYLSNVAVFGEALLVCASDTIQVNWRMVGKNFTWDLDGLFEHSDEQSLEDKI